MEENTIRIHGQKIEALENGKVLLNDKELSSIYEVEQVLNLLIKSCIAIVRG